MCSRPPGRKLDPLYHIRKLLLVAAQEQLTSRARAGRGTGLPSVTRQARWRPLGRANSCCEPSTPRSPAGRSRRPGALLPLAAGVGVAELSRLAAPWAWEGEILAFHSAQGCSNGSTEAISLLTNAKRLGHGLRNVAN
jgi:hypothetical protein